MSLPRLTPRVYKPRLTCYVCKSHHRIKTWRKPCPHCGSRAFYRGKPFPVVPWDTLPETGPDTITKEDG